MSRMIDIDDDRNCFCGNDGEYQKWNIDPDVLKEAIKIVRCKNCKWWNQAMCHSSVAPDVRLCMCMNVYTDPDQFCKYGEKRVENG